MHAPLISDGTGGGGTECGMINRGPADTELHSGSLATVWAPLSLSCDPELSSLQCKMRPSDVNNLYDPHVTHSQHDQTLTSRLLMSRKSLPLVSWSILSAVQSIDIKNVFFTFFILVTFLRFLTFSYFLYVFKIKNVENLLSLQAYSEISVLHLTNDRFNCSGLLLLSTFFVSCWAYYMRVGI